MDTGSLLTSTRNESFPVRETLNQGDVKKLWHREGHLFYFILKHHIGHKKRHFHHQPQKGQEDVELTFVLDFPYRNLTMKLKEIQL